MTASMTTVPGDSTGVGHRTVPYPALLSFGADVFASAGISQARARQASEALCYGDLTGHGTHGLVNLTRLYLPLLDTGRVRPEAEPRVAIDRGPTVLLDAAGTLGLWQAAAAMDLAVERAKTFGIGLVSVRGATHIGCLGYHALRAVSHGMVGVVASNCGRQRIAPPPGGRVALLGTNPLSVAAPAGGHHPFVLDMSTTAVPTGRIRAAARDGDRIPPGWLATEADEPVTDPAAFDRGEARLRWLGGSADTGGYKGFGLGLAVEVLTALVSGSGRGPDPAALTGADSQDDDIGLMLLAVAPAHLRPGDVVAVDAEALFGTVLACPPVAGGDPVRYPGWWEGQRAERHRRAGVPLPTWLYDELVTVAAERGLPAPVCEPR